jgi:hypothetical protein
MREEAANRFESRLYENVCGLFGSMGSEWDAASIKARIHREVEFARGFGFTRECEVARYVEIVCSALTAGVARLSKEALAVLQDRGRNATQRLDSLALCLGVTARGD